MESHILSNNHAIQDSYFFCFCGQKIKITPEEDLSKHIKNCKNYSNDSPISKIFFNINLGKLNLPQLIALKLEYMNYIDVLSNEMEKRGFQSKQVVQSIARPHPQGLSSSISPPKKLEPNDPVFDLESLKTSAFRDKNLENGLNLGFLAQQKILCLNCKKEFVDFDVQYFWYLNTCCHCFCRACLMKSITQEYVKNNGQVKCLLQGCKHFLNEEDYKNIMKEKFDKLTEELLEKQFNIVKCAKCQEKYEFIKGKPEAHMRDGTGKMIPKHLAIHYAENRFTCLNQKCKTEQCVSCKAIPYHQSFLCEEFAKNQHSKKCRYCEVVIQKIDKSLPLAIQEICTGDECKEKVANACQKMLKCNHPCSGYVNELNCLPCLNDDCAEKIKDSLLNQKGSDYCNICFVEGLGNAPCVMIKCGHIFHIHCIGKRLEIRWHRPRITFNFCLCPLCKAWMEFPVDSPLQVKMEENLAMFEDIKKKSLERLKHEGKDKDERLSNKHDPYYNKPMEYAIAIYSYYQCFKCKKPYFGGLKSCEMMLQEENQGKQDFDPKELVCANCCDVLPLENCQKHGKDYIEFKCKFCCNIAQWFCWGNTHFCEPCHKRQCNGDYVSKYGKDKLPKCTGKDKCPLKIDHKPNGEEFALGCSLCRNFKENQKGF